MIIPNIYVELIEESIWTQLECSCRLTIPMFLIDHWSFSVTFHRPGDIGLINLISIDKTFTIDPFSPDQENISTFEVIFREEDIVKRPNHCSASESVVVF
jgi:hypothetical protein